MAADNAMIRSGFYHPQHLLARYQYAGGSIYACAACELIVAGTGYRCDQCDFNIHEACLSLPLSFSFRKHRKHELTLTRLGASRWCNVCNETSHAGRFLYRCVPCNYDVHPRCTKLVAHRRGEGRRRGGTLNAIASGASLILVGVRVVDLVTGGSLSSAIDAMEAAVGNMQQ